MLTREINKDYDEMVPVDDFGGDSMHRGTYYREKLSADRLVRCYEIAPPRIKQYLDAEIKFTITNLQRGDLVLELGCGYGRVMREVSRFVSHVVGNDISKESLDFARSYLRGCPNCTMSLMDASEMAFCSCTFDVVFCIQNGISAFGVNMIRLAAESVRVAKVDGTILFSSYSPRIWSARLEWFRRQSHLGLIGEIDMGKSRDGSIFCRDGFTATTVNSNCFIELFNKFGLDASIIEVDQSSIFCKVKKEK